MKYFLCVMLIGVMSIMSSCLYGQITKNDLWHENLKGDVSKLVECRRIEQDKFGETIVTLDTIKITYFNDLGNISLSIMKIEPGSYSEMKNVYKHYIYNEDDCLSQIDYYADVIVEDGAFGAPDKCKFKKIANETFEYVAGKIISITFQRDERLKVYVSDTEGYYLTGCGARTHYAHRRESVNPYRKAFDKDFYQTGGYKIIYEYNETGYTVKSYDLHNGSLLCGYSVEDNGKKVTYLKDPWVTIRKFDDNLNLQMSATAASADNGNIVSQTYYKYDDKGNLIFETSDIEYTKKEYTIAYNKQNYRISDYYTYEYDSNNNWIKASCYESNRLSIMYSRFVEYGNYYDVEELLSVKNESLTSVSIIPKSPRHDLFVLWTLKAQEYESNSDIYNQLFEDEIIELHKAFLKCAGLNESQEGEMFLFMAQIWAEEMDECSLPGAKYWAAAMCLKTAKQLNPNLKDDCDKLFEKYSYYFPDQQTLDSHQIQIEDEIYEVNSEGIIFPVYAIPQNWNEFYYSLP